MLSQAPEVPVGRPRLASPPVQANERRIAGGKLLQLESLRGLAALVVVIHHGLQCFWPAMLNAPPDSLGHWALRWLAASPLKVIYGGRFPVELFFVLSGFVLSYSFLRRHDSTALASGALRRYFRLALPITGSVLLVYGLMSLHCIFAVEVGSLVPGSFLGIAYRFPPSLGGALAQGAAATFHTEGVLTNYNTVLWTMRPEFMGSMLVYILLAWVGRFRVRWLAYGAAVALAGYWEVQLANFVMGMALCDLHVNWAGFRVAQRLGSRLCILLLCAAALYIGGYTWPGPWYPAVVFDVTSRWPSFGAVLLIACALASPDLSRLLVKRPLVWLGKVSFSLYLIHLPVLASLGAYCYWRAREGLGWSETAGFVVALGVGIAGSLLVAWAFFRIVEAPSLSFAKWFGDAAATRLSLTGKNSAAMQPAGATGQRTPPADAAMWWESQFIALLAIAISIGCGAFLGLAWLRDVNMDLQAHMRMIAISLESRSWPPNFLYYWTVALCAGFSTDADHLMLSTVAVLGVSCGLRFLVSVWVGCRLLGELPGWNQRRGLRYAFYIAVALLQVSHNIIDVHQPNTYIGYFPANVWHNSTMIFLMPWAILMFYFAWRALTRCRPGDLWMLAILGLINVAIKNSFVLVLVPVMTVATLVQYHMSWKTIRIGLALVPPVAFIGLQTLMIYSPFFADSVLARYHERMGVSGESRIAFEFLALWPPHTISTILCSFLYPISLLVLFRKQFAGDKLVRLAAACLCVGLLLFMCLVETGFRRMHGNFTWQVLVCTYIFFLACIIFQFRQMLLRSPDEQRIESRDMIPAVPYALHVICGLLYMGMFVIARSGR